MVKRAPGSGSVYQRKDGKWVAEVPVGRGSRGSRERRYLYAPSKREAEARRRDALRAIEAGLQPPDPRLTVGTHLRSWLDWQRDRVRPSTWVSYEGHVRMHLASIHQVPLVRLAPNDVRGLIRRLVSEGLSSTTVRYSVTVLRMALKQAVSDGLVPRNVAAVVQSPKVVRQGTASLSVVEARRLVKAAAGDRLGALWLVAMTTGLRQGELLGLRWSDVDLDAGYIRVTGSLRPIPTEFRDGKPRLQRVAPKTDNGYRAAPLFSIAVDRLRELRDAAAGEQLRNLEGYVFTTPRGTPLDGRNVYREWHRFLAESDLPTIRFHDLRHSMISVLLALGASMEDLVPIVGHFDERQTWDYAHVQPESWDRIRVKLEEGLA
jgi:integrase